MPNLRMLGSKYRPLLLVWCNVGCRDCRSGVQGTVLRSAPALQGLLSRLKASRMSARTTQPSRTTQTVGVLLWIEGDKDSSLGD